MEGQVSSRYAIEQKIGEGGMGVVYRARDTRLNRIVAIKMLAPQSARDPELRRRLEIEARAASALNHPGIATVFDFEATDDSAFIVYEYVDGITLRTLIRQGGMNLAEVLSICIKIADGLVAAHNSGILHRDLKPENVMIAEGGRVKILDFGLAKVLSRADRLADYMTAGSTLPGLIIGTLAYMSPEQLHGETIDLRADLFAFGIMLYEMTTGQHPFAGKSPNSTIGNILKEEPQSVSQLVPKAPAKLQAVIHKCLRKDRNERYASVRELLADLEATQNQLTDSAKRFVTPIDAEISMSKSVARFLFLLIQFGYITLYAAVLYWIDPVIAVLSRDLYINSPLALPFILVLATCGITLRIYLISAVGLNHPDIGVKFHRLFPVLIVMDFVWSASPILLQERIGLGLAFAFVAGFAYLPFSQRTLMQVSYRV